MSNRAGDVMVACPRHHAGRGGSIPTPALSFYAGLDEDATALVLKFHYSHRMPNVQFVGTFHLPGGLFGDCGPAVAACVFSTPPTKWSEPVIELSRLVRDEAHRVPLTRLIRLTVIYLKRTGKGDLLVSFADWTQKHHGGVYQAAGWNYDGMRAPQMDGLIVNGDFVPGRSCNQAWDTRSPEKLAEKLGSGHSVAPHWDEGKHLYWKALNADGEAKAKRLGLRRQAYPKPTASR